MAESGKIDNVSPIVKFIFEGSEFDFGTHFQDFRWESFINSGYKVFGKFGNPYQSVIQDDDVGNILLRARNEILEAKFSIKWTDSTETTTRSVIITHINTYGEGGNDSFITIEGIDPASWVLLHGKAKGDVKEGKISTVINEVVSEASSDVGFNISLDMQETTDNEKNLWYRMKLDPKTLINTMLEWSIHVADNDNQSTTAWAIQSEDKDIVIKDWSKIKPYEQMNGIEYSVNNQGSANRVDIDSIRVGGNFLLGTTSPRMISSGISSITGKLFSHEDKQYEDDLRIWDKNTAKKINVSTDKDRSTTKPDDNVEWATYLNSIPEHNNGELGIKYNKYMAGKSRDWFIKSLYTTLRCSFDVYGEYKCDSVKVHGKTKVKLNMVDVNGDPYYLYGDWIIYGFQHIVTRKSWITRFHVSRLDHDASSQKI